MVRRDYFLCSQRKAPRKTSRWRKRAAERRQPNHHAPPIGGAGRAATAGRNRRTSGGYCAARFNASLAEAIA